MTFHEFCTKFRALAFCTEFRALSVLVLEIKFGALSLLVLAFSVLVLEIKFCTEFQALEIRFCTEFQALLVLVQIATENFRIAI